MVSDLLSFSYGQKSSVAIPGASLPSTIGQGKYPAGVNDVLEYIINQYTKWGEGEVDPSQVEWLFLVGGPGNGKSQALTTFAGALGLPLPQVGASQQVPRVIPQTWPVNGFPVCGKLEAVFINDASISRVGLGQANGGSLFHDLHDAAIRIKNNYPTAVFANINRGILVEEAHALPGPAVEMEKKIAVETILWLAAPRSQNENIKGKLGEFLGQVTVAQAADTPYYSQLTYKSSATSLAYDIIIHAVFLDALSLLESSPSDGVTGHAIDFSNSPPTVAPYRPVGGLLPSLGCRENTIAGERTAYLSIESKWEQGECCEPEPCDACDYCPFIANARWLRDPTLRDRFLATMRAAEIASGRRFTYRDLMGHLSLSILGCLEEEWLRGIHPCDWVAKLHKEISSNGSNKHYSVIQFANHRIYASLFCTTDRGVWTELGTDKQGAPLHSTLVSNMQSPLCIDRQEAYEIGFGQIDPARDASSWRRDILDAVDSIEVESPTSMLSSQGLLPNHAFGLLEETLDILLAEEMVSVHAGSTAADATRRRALLHWRCVLLLRQAGLANNNITFKPAVEYWLEEQLAALTGNAPQTDLGNGLRTLVVQPANISGTPRMLIAPLRPRTYALNVIPPDTVVVGLNVSQIQVLPVAEGDTMSAEVRVLVNNNFEEVASFPIDLAIAREAMIQVSFPGVGFTEIGSSTFARIERTRAVLIGRQRMSRGNVDFVDSRGKIRSIRHNSGGSIPYQVT